jgi:hypothetical protein
MKPQMSPLKKGLTPRRQVAKQTRLKKKPFAALATLREISGFLQCSHLWFVNCGAKLAKV